MSKFRRVGLARTDAEARKFAHRLRKGGDKVFVGPPKKENPFKKKSKKFRSIFVMR